MLDIEAAGPEYIYATFVDNKQQILSTALFRKDAMLYWKSVWGRIEQMPEYTVGRRKVQKTLLIFLTFPYLPFIPDIERCLIIMLNIDKDFTSSKKHDYLHLNVQNYTHMNTNLRFIFL